MNKIKLKQINKQLISGIVAGTITLTLVGCGKKDEDTNTEAIIQPTSIVYMENDEEKINLEKVFALKSEDDGETLFVKYNNEDDTYVTDVFTNAKYTTYDSCIDTTLFPAKRKVKKSFNGLSLYIYDKKYYYENISNYMYATTDDLKKYNSYEVLKQAFINANNIHTEELNLPEEEMIDLKNIIVLEHESSTLYVKYDNLEDKFVTDVFTNCKYLTKSTNEVHLKDGEVIIDNVDYLVENIITYPYVFKNIKDGKISKNILHESFKKANENKEKILTKQK